MFKRKFKVRVIHYSQEYYCVQYTYYIIFTNWKCLTFWFDCGLTNNLERFSINLMSYQKAEELAKTLNSPQDVINYYKPFLKEQEDCQKRKLKFIAENIPYKIKNIK